MSIDGTIKIAYVAAIGGDATVAVCCRCVDVVAYGLATQPAKVVTRRLRDHLENVHGITDAVIDHRGGGGIRCRRPIQSR